MTLSRYPADAPLPAPEEAFREHSRTERCFELEQHRRAEEEALERVRPYAQAWELPAWLMPGDFRLQFQQAEIIDRNPPPPEPGRRLLPESLQ